jgi:hypothetical protein
MRAYGGVHHTFYKYYGQAPAKTQGRDFCGPSRVPETSRTGDVLSAGDDEAANVMIEDD